MGAPSCRQEKNRLSRPASTEIEVSGVTPGGTNPRYDEKPVLFGRNTGCKGALYRAPFFMK